MSWSRTPLTGSTLVAAQRTVRLVILSRSPLGASITRPTMSSSANGASPSTSRLPRKRSGSTGAPR
ncbi:hypothetical protein EBB05_17450 [Methylobacterium brachiatum]|nr:hypothetical protein EBB05_17450 [Methylobacterium brachiatum]